jgi:GAF domain-containing protein
MAGEHFIDPGALERSLAGVKREMAAGGLMEELQQVLESACRLFGASGAGFMMVDDSAMLRAVAATDQPGRRLEELQVEDGHGPCVDALTFDRVVTTDDLAGDERWPALRPELPDAGVRAVLGVPIHVSGVPVGSLNVYRNRPSSWGDSEVSALRSYAGLIGSLLRNALHAREGERLAQQLQHALDNRVQIERAVGVVMGRERVDAVTAFNQLRDIARSGQRKVVDVAIELLQELPGGD